MLKITFEKIRNEGFTIEEVEPMLHSLNFEKQNDSFNCNLEPIIRRQIKDIVLKSERTFLIGFVEEEHLKYISIFDKNYIFSRSEHEYIGIVVDDMKGICPNLFRDVGFEFLNQQGLKLITANQKWTEYWYPKE